MYIAYIEKLPRVVRFPSFQNLSHLFPNEPERLCFSLISFLQHTRSSASTGEFHYWLTASFTLGGDDLLFILSSGVFRHTIANCRQHLCKCREDDLFAGLIQTSPRRWKKKKIFTLFSKCVTFTRFCSKIERRPPGSSIFISPFFFLQHRRQEGWRVPQYRRNFPPHTHGRPTFVSSSLRLGPCQYMPLLPSFTSCRSLQHRRLWCAAEKLEINEL